MLAHARRRLLPRAFTTLLVSILVVLLAGLALVFVLLRHMEAQLISAERVMAEKEVTFMTRWVEDELTRTGSTQATINRLQHLINGTGAEGEFVCLLDEEGRVLSHPDASMLGAERGAMTVNLDRAEPAATLHEILRRRHRASGHIGPEGEPAQLVRYEPVAGVGWTIGVHRNLSVIADRFAALRRGLLSVALPVWLAAGLLGGLALRSLAQWRERELAERNATLEGLVQERTRQIEQNMAELRVAHERLLQGEKMHLLGELMAGIAHEINNPLMAISGYAELLAGRTEGDSARHARAITHQAQRVGSIVRNLLNFARNRPAERRLASMAKVVQQAVELLEAELRRSAVELSLELPPDLPPIMMDAQQMEQVLINLIRNAEQALSTVSGPRQINVTASREGMWLHVVVTDNGPGLSPEVRGKLFDSFFTTKEEGTGLGLSLCRRFVEAHGGAITLLPDGGGGLPGARFRLQLPVAPAADA